jgi:hypothetical protein
MRLYSGPEPAYQLPASMAPLSLGQIETPLKRNCQDIVRCGYGKDREDERTV